MPQSIFLLLVETVETVVSEETEAMDHLVQTILVELPVPEVLEEHEAD